MSKTLYILLSHQQRQLNVLAAQISILSLTASQATGIRELTPLQREFRDVEQVSQILLNQYQTDLPNFTDTQPVPLVRYSMRVARNSMRVLKEHRIKIIILVLLIILSIIGKGIPEWIGMLFSRL